MLLFGVLFVLSILAAAYAVRREDGLVHVVAAFFALVAQALWSVNYLDSRTLNAGLVVYGAFALLYAAVPMVASRLDRILLRR